MRFLTLPLLALMLVGCHGSRALTSEGIRANVVADARIDGTATLTIEGVPERFCTDRSGGVVVVCNDNATSALTAAIGEILSQYGLTPAASAPNYTVVFRMVGVQSALAGGNQAAIIDARWQLTMDSADGRRLIAAAETSRAIISSKDLTPVFRAITDRVAQLVRDAAHAQPVMQPAPTVPPQPPATVPPSEEPAPIDQSL